MTTNQKKCDFGEIIREKAKILQDKGLSKFETAIYLLFLLLPFFSISKDKGK